MAVFVYPNDAEDRVLVRATFADVPGVQDVVTVTRVLADGSEQVVAAASTPLCDEVYVNDTTPPRGATFHYRINATPDDPVLISADVTLTADEDLVWLRDPTRPWADLRMGLCATRSGPCDTTAPDPCLTFVRWGTETYAADAELTPVLGRPRPADVYARRKDADVGQLRFLTTHADGDCSCIERVRTLFTAGGPVHLSFPAAYCIPDRCYQPFNLSMAYLTDRVDQRKPWRVWDMRLVAVDCPTGPKQGVAGATWCDVDERYATYADLTGTGQSWGEIRDGLPPLVATGYGVGPYGSGPYGDPA